MAGPRLILHFDINQTLMVSDPAGGVTFEEGLNKALAQSAMVKANDAGDWQWHDGSPLNPDQRAPGAPCPPLYTKGLPRPDGWVPFGEAFRGQSRTFTTKGPGVIFRPQYEELWKAMTWDGPPDPELGPNGMHFLVPSLFHCLLALHHSGRRFRVVFRTFGTDLPEVRAAFTAFTKGKHPQFPLCPISDTFKLDRGAWVIRHENAEDSHSAVYLQDTTPSSTAEALHGGEPIAAFFTSADTTLTIQDEYDHWKRHNFLPASGKPVWYTASATEDRHIFFDDNIHYDAKDSIVAVHARASSDAPFRALSGEDTLQYTNVLLVKANLVAAILNPDYFLQKIQETEAMWQEKRLQLPVGDDPRANTTLSP